MFPPPTFPPTSFAPAYAPPSSEVVAGPSQRRTSQQFYPTPVSPTASSNPYLTPSTSFNRASISAPVAIPSSPVYPQQVQQPRPSTASSLSGAIPPAINNPPVIQQPLPPPVNPYLTPASSMSQIEPSTSQPPSLGVAMTRGAGQSTHGAWSDEETDRLKYLAEQSRSRTTNGEVDWDWTVESFGETRSR